MLSDSLKGCLYLAQVRCGPRWVEQVRSSESHDFFGAKDYAVRLARWLARGWACELDLDALDLRADIEAAGLDPARAVVELVRLRATGPDTYDLRGEVLCVVHDLTDPDDDDDSDDTVIIVDVPQATAAG